MVDSGCYCYPLSDFIILFTFKIVLGMKKYWFYFTDKQTEALHRRVK